MNIVCKISAIPLRPRFANLPQTKLKQNHSEYPYPADILEPPMLIAFVWFHQ